MRACSAGLLRETDALDASADPFYAHCRRHTDQLTVRLAVRDCTKGGWGARPPPRLVGVIRCRHGCLHKPKYNGAVGVRNLSMKSSSL